MTEDDHPGAVVEVGDSRAAGYNNPDRAVAETDRDPLDPRPDLRPIREWDLKSRCAFLQTIEMPVKGEGLTSICLEHLKAAVAS